MAEYIKREAVIDLITRRYENPEICKAEINAIPAGDVAPVRHGRWFDVQETELYVPDMKFTMTKTAETCSECKVRIGFVGAKQYLYDAVCPNCGAKMDGDEVKMEG